MRGSARFAIGGRDIGASHEPYVIAEIGVNHDGQVGRAKELVQVARDAGADAVKFQLFDAELLMSADAAFAQYQRGAEENDPRAMLHGLELPLAAMAELVALARSLAVHPIVTVFSVGLVAAAESLDWAAYKVASPDVVHRPLLQALARTGRPLVVSTGASTIAEVNRSRAWTIATEVAYLHCVSAYPTPEEDASLAGIAELADAIGCVVGYSDHTVAVDVGGLAVAAGAAILEKHLTYDRRAKGPDHAASLDPTGFAEYVALARRAWRLRGSGKSVREVELDVRTVSRQSLVTARRLRAGEVLASGDLVVKRPGTGIEPWRLDEVVGRTLARDREADRVLVDEDLA